MLRFSKLIELPAISVSTGKQIGVVHDVILTPESMRVMAIVIINKKLIKKEQVIKAEDIMKVGKNAILIHEKANLINIEEYKLDSKAKRYRKDIAEIPVYTDSGINIGAVQDAIFNFEIGTLAEFEISDGVIQDLIEGRKKIRVSESIHLEKGIVILDNDKMNDIKNNGRGLKRILSERK